MVGRHLSALKISREAAEIFVQSHVIDLHIESYSFYRSFGYNPIKRHELGWHRGVVVGQVDVPRLVETGINGGTWVISANPLRPADLRDESFRYQMKELKALLNDSESGALVVRTEREYQAAVQKGKHACFLGIQGANALPPDPDCLKEYADDLLRITLLHLTDSAWGATSTPHLRKLWRGECGLRALGYAFVERMNDLKIGVDLAHIHERGFWDAMHTADPSQPILVTHTGVRKEHDHWRNLSDKQLKAVANTGGLIGIMYHAEYLGDGLFSGKLHSLVRHITHTLSIVGPDHVALGSDWDGAIFPPRDMPTCAELPKLVDALLAKGVNTETIVKILGNNFLRFVKMLKGSD